MSNVEGYFHLRGGFYFRREANGDITIMLGSAEAGGQAVRISVPSNEFASVMASVSARGETGETWREACDYLDRQRDGGGQG